MSREILDCLKRKQDICIKNVIPSQNTAFMCTPALNEAISAQDIIGTLASDNCNRSFHPDDLLLIANNPNGLALDGVMYNYSDCWLGDKEGPYHGGYIARKLSLCAIFLPDSALTNRFIYVAYHYYGAGHYDATLVRGEYQYS